MIGARIGASIGRRTSIGGQEDFWITVTGGGGANAADTVTIPTHAPGDIIIIGAGRQNNGAATVPTAGGTVPTWTTILTGGADTLSLVTVWTIATASNHTSGTFTNATRMVVCVIRANRPVTIGASASGNGAAVESVTYPALTRQTTTGPLGIRLGIRATGGNDTELDNPPTGWTFVSHSAATPFLVLHKKEVMTANPGADVVTTAGAAAAYRCHTIEVRETS